MRPHRLSALAAVVLVGACSSAEPFVDLPLDNKLNKVTPVDSRGTVSVCYGNDTPRAEVLAMAAEACASYGLEALLVDDLRYQCRMTVPHRATFQCVDPAMTRENGRPINPLDPKDVAEWEKQTGKQRRPNLGQRVLTPAERPAAAAPGSEPPPPAPIPETVPAPAAPPAAPVTRAAPAPSAADLNPPRPVPPAQPAVAPSPPPPPALPDDSGFRLPVGTWGDAFRE